MIPKLRLFLLLILCALVAGGGTGPGYSLVAQASPLLDDWGEPCPLPHPEACYSGSSQGGLQTRPGWMAMGSFAPLSNPSAVEMICFSAQGADEQVIIEWQTATEFDTAGFYLKRSTNSNDSFEDISGFVPHCDTSGVVGGYYAFTDFDVSNGNTYYYRLEEIDGSGDTIIHGDPAIVAVPSQSSPTPTPSSTPSKTPTNTPVTPNSTDDPGQPSPTPTPTARNTPRPSPTFSATPSPTDIGAPTATPTPSPSPALGSTFTPASTGPLPTNTRPPTATRRVFATPTSQSIVTENQTVDVSGSPQTNTTPVVVAQVGTPLSGTAYPAPFVEESAPAIPTAYPGPLGNPPTVTPFPDDYVPPATYQSFQLATMTPTLVDPADQSYPVENTDESAAAESEVSPRMWLYVGFVLALLALAAGLVAMIRFGQKSPESDQVEPSPADDSE